jgi:hypothetical protein
VCEREREREEERVCVDERGNGAKRVLENRLKGCREETASTYISQTAVKAQIDRICLG